MLSFYNKHIKPLFSSKKIVLKTTTPYNYLEVVKYKGNFILDSRNTNYSYGKLHKVFQYAFEQIPFDKNSVHKALILGFGAGSVASILKKEMNCNCTVTGIEIDKEIINLAKKYFELDKLPGIEIIIDDAFNFTQNCNKKFDLIITDIFNDHKIPPQFNSNEFLENVNKLLNKNGMVYYNRLCYDYKSKRANKVFEKKFKSIFENTKTVDTSNFSKNKIYFGTKQHPFT